MFSKADSMNWASGSGAVTRTMGSSGKMIVPSGTAYYLFETCGDAESAIIGHSPKEIIEVGPLIFFPADIVSPNHGELIEVRQ